MIRLIGIAAIATVCLLQACAPDLPVVKRRVTTVVGLDQNVGKQTLDSIYWYTGFRPDSLVLAAGILRLVMPAESVGHEIESSPTGACTSHAIPFGVVRRVARVAWRNAGQPVGADTVFVTVGKLKIEARGWGGHRMCSSGPAGMRVTPEQLRGSD